jgi:metallo-beta-lactamase class B
MRRAYRRIDPQPVLPESKKALALRAGVILASAPAQKGHVEGEFAVKRSPSRLDRFSPMLVGILATLAFAGGAPAQEAPPPSERPPVSSYPHRTEFPMEDHARVADYLARARAIAGDDLFPDFVHRCITDQVYRQRANALQFNGLLGPAKVFDQLYFVGQNAVSAWALDTDKGIILFDSLNNADEARDIIVPGLRKMGLDPARIRYVVITHSHGDHYGGAAYLRDTFKARLIASEQDWDVMEAMRRSGHTGPFPIPPARDIAVHDGGTFQLGNETLHFYVTPGHTPGTLSTIFDVTDHGAKHVAAFFGGFGAPRDPKLRYTLIASMDRFASLARTAGADTLIANHPLQDGAFEKIELLRYRRPGDANPYVVGADRLDRYFKVQIACNKVGLLRAGLDLEAGAP